MYTFFSHPTEISYKASFCSKIGVFYLITTILTFIPPLLITYRSQGTYFKLDFWILEPLRHYSIKFVYFKIRVQKLIWSLGNWKNYLGECFHQYGAKRDNFSNIIQYNHLSKCYSKKSQFQSWQSKSLIFILIATIENTFKRPHTMRIPMRYHFEFNPRPYLTVPFQY